MEAAFIVLPKHRKGRLGEPSLLPVLRGRPGSLAVSLDLQVREGAFPAGERLRFHAKSLQH